MAIYFARTAAAFSGAAAPSNSSDGRDPIGLALTAATWVQATKTLTDTSGTHPFLHARVGDLIYLNSDLNTWSGLVAIASVDASGDFVTMASHPLDDGDDVDADDVNSASGPFATFAKLVSVLNAGHVGRMVDDGINLTAQVTSANSGSAVSEILVERADTHGEPDHSGRVTVAPNAAFTNNNLLVTLGSRSYWIFRNIAFDSAANGGGTATGVLTGAHTHLVDCSSANSNGSGFSNGSDTCKYVRCIAHNNVTHGLSITGGVAMHCSAYANGSNGVDLGPGETGIVVENCICFGNGGDGVGGGGSGYGATIRQNTCINNSGDGVEIGPGQYGTMLRDNISQNNSGYGYRYNGAPLSAFVDIGGNQANGNTLGDGDA